jgi:pyrroline-5-carboxylate reductase
VPKLKKSIGFLGAGNMAEAFVGALIRSALCDPAEISVSDILNKRLEIMKKTYGVAATSDNAAVYAQSDVVIMAVKPQQTAELLSQIAEKEQLPFPGKKLFISIAAGIPIRKIENYLYSGHKETDRKNLPIIRVMPNTPALVLAGISGMSANQYADTADIQLAKAILGALGDVIEFGENDLDAVTALSGSGPAYVFYLIESMIAGGIANGLDAQAAARLTLKTIEGSVKLMQERSETPQGLRRKVTSPGGTTEAALKVLNGHKVNQSIIEAITAATQRSRELSR